MAYIESQINVSWLWICLLESEYEVESLVKLIVMTPDHFVRLRLMLSHYCKWEEFERVKFVRPQFISFRCLSFTVMTQQKSHKMIENHHLWFRWLSLWGWFSDLALGWVMKRLTLKLTLTLNSTRLIAKVKKREVLFSARETLYVQKKVDFVRVRHCKLYIWFQITLKRLKNSKNTKKFKCTMSHAHKVYLTRFVFFKEN